MTQLSTKDGEPVKNPGQILYSTNTKGEWSKLTEYEQAAWENSARDFLAALGATVVRWIPASERLPTEQKVYMTAHQDGFVGSGHWASGKWLITGTEHEMSDVTHWAEPLTHPEATR